MKLPLPAPVENVWDTWRHGDSQSRRVLRAALIIGGLSTGSIVSGGLRTVGIDLSITSAVPETSAASQIILGLGGLTVSGLMANIVSTGDNLVRNGDDEQTDN